jgi:rubrerythrin
MIDEAAFNKTSELLNSFKSSIKYESKTNLVELLEYAIQFEIRNKIALEYILESTHGQGEAQLSFKKLVQELIAAEEGHSKNLMNFKPKGN